jgi:nucleotide-binding universal stress UspA family protein
MAEPTASVETSANERMRPIQPLKRVLVHVDRDRAAEARVEVAINLALKFGGQVTGVYVARPILPPAIVMGALPPAFLADEAELNERDAAAARRHYLDHVVRHGLNAGWHYIREGSVEGFRRISRYMDLTIVGQPKPEVPEELLAIRPEEVALVSGRPVLVVPYIGGSSSPGKRIVIAWDESREAARAVGDALPILMQASSVWIVSVGAKGSSATAEPGAGETLARFLADHAIVAKAETLYPDECSEGDVLLSRIADFGADLLVMGCYGHTRLRELVLGGMTREILQHMTVPVLMSH